MSKRLSVVAVAVVLLITVALVALPGRSQQDAWKDYEQLQSQLRREAARIQAEMLQMQVRLSAEMERLRGTELQKQLEQIEAQRAKILEGPELARAELVAHQVEVAEHAREMAERAAEQGHALGPVEIWTEEGDDSGWLGLSIAEVASDKAKELKLPATRGVLVTEVEADSPAAKAGLKANDVITEYNGQHIEGTVQFRRLVRETPAGRTAALSVWRDGRTQTVSVELGNFRERFEKRFRAFGPRDFNFRFEMPELGNILTLGRPVLGIDAEDLSGQLGSYFGAPDGEGILVRDVRSGTPAEKAGLKAGDVITKVDGQRVRMVNQLRERLREAREKKSVSLGIIRKGAEMSLNVEIEQPKPPERRTVSRRVVI